MRRAHAGNAPRRDLAALGDERVQQPHVLVVDVVDLVDAEPAHLLAPEILLLAGDRFVAAGGPHRRTLWVVRLFVLPWLTPLLSVYLGALLRWLAAAGLLGAGRAGHRCAGHGPRAEPGSSCAGAAGAASAGRACGRRASRDASSRFSIFFSFSSMRTVMNLITHVGHAQAALDFLHQSAGPTSELHQHVEAFVALLHAIGQLAHAPLVVFVDGAAGVGDHVA